MKRTIVKLLVVIFLFPLMTQPVLAAEKKNSELADSARSAILIERDTGKILYEKNSNQELPLPV